MVKQLKKERRQGIRAKRVLAIQYRLFKRNRKKAEHEWQLSTTHDMSYSGVAFFSGLTYASGDILEVRIAISGILDIYDGLAEVVRVSKKKKDAFYLVAVMLTGPKPRKRKAKTYHPSSKRKSVRRITKTKRK